MDSVSGDVAEALQQSGEGVLDRYRGALVREDQAAVELEPRVVDRRVAVGEVEAGPGEGGDLGTRGPTAAGGGSQGRGRLGRGFEGDGADDLAPAAEVAAEGTASPTSASPSSSPPSRSWSPPVSERAGRRGLRGPHPAGSPSRNGRTAACQAPGWS